MVVGALVVLVAAVIAPALVARATAPGFDANAGRCADPVTAGNTIGYTRATWEIRYSKMCDGFWIRVSDATDPIPGFAHIVGYTCAAASARCRGDVQSIAIEPGQTFSRMIQASKHPRVRACYDTKASTGPFEVCSERRRVPAIVVIDPGHGAIIDSRGREEFQRDPARNGLIEDEVVLDISKRLESLLHDAGYGVHLTRSDRLAPFAPKGCGVPCGVDTRERRRWAERRNPDALISVHTNAAPSSRANGVETFRYGYGPSNAVDLTERALAANVQRRLVELGLENRGVKTNPWNVITSGSVPSILVEVGFHTGRTDADRLADPEFRQRAAAAMYAAIAETNLRQG